MIERVRIDPLLHRIRPLLVGDGDVSNWPSDSSPESIDHLSYSQGFSKQSVCALRGGARICQQCCGHTGYVFGADKRNDSLILAPWQEGCALLGNAAADKGPHVFVVGRRLEMNSSHLRPVENAIGQSMLQIAETGSMLQIAKSGISGPTLKLGIVHH